MRKFLLSKRAEGFCGISPLPALERKSPAPAWEPEAGQVTPGPPAENDALDERLSKGGACREHSSPSSQ
jgi:hypothetical protein